MLLELNGTTHKLRFFHYNPNNPKFSSGPSTAVIWGTTAVLEKSAGDGEERHWESLARGEAFLAPVDYRRYDRETGRKISLGRLLLSAFPGDTNKELRRDAWTQYLNRPRIFTSKTGDTNGNQEVPVQQGEEHEGNAAVTTDSGVQAGSQ